MDIINISKNKFNKLEPLVLANGVRNSECDLFKFKYGNRNMVLKKLYFTNGNTFGNKLYTLEALSTNKRYLPDSFILPEFLVSINKRIEAFALPYVEGENLSVVLKNPMTNYEDKIYYLKRIGQLLEQMKNTRRFTDLKDFYLGDLHEDNFIIDTSKREVYVNDVDSIKIANNFSFPARYLNKSGLLNGVEKKYHIDKSIDSLTSYIADENTDLYCYVIVILNYLYGGNVNNMSLDDFYKYLNYLDYLKLDKRLLECFERILSNGSNLNPVYYIDTLTAEQIGRANNKVYRLNR